MRSGIPKGWSVKLGRRFVSLPNSLELQKGEFMVQPDLLTFLQLREKIISQLSTYTIYDNLSNENKLVLQEIIRLGVK